MNPLPSDTDTAMTDLPALRRLILRVDSRSLSALMLGPEGAERRAVSHVAPLEELTVKALEYAVYEAPVLLGDFERVDVVFATPFFTPAPAGLSAETETAMAEAMVPDYEAPRRLLADSFPGGRLLYWADTDMVNFLSRTFAQTGFRHSLAVTAGYMDMRHGADGDGRGRLYAVCEPRTLHMAGFGADGRLETLQFHDPKAPEDFAYYILAAAADRNIPVEIGGEPELRNRVCDLLASAEPQASLLPMSLPEELVRLRRMLPDVPADMIFMTQL